MNKQNNCMHTNTRVASSLDPIIDNGSLVQMGINETAELNVPGGTPSMGTTFVGLRYIPTNGESTAHGCLCEGWGVANADAATGTFTAYANQSVDGGAVNLTVQPGTGSYGVGQLLPESVATSFRSIVTDTADNRVRVIHDYKPSPVTPNLYQVDVTITNIGTTPIGDLRYRRVMDWDIPPTIFNEFVEIHVGTSANLVAATTDGFQSGNPLSSRGPLVGAPPTTLVSGSPDYFGGPTDQGSLFDFTFGALAPGATKIFTIFYGAGANRQEILDAIIAVGAEMYSFGFPTDFTTTPPTAAINGPNAFVFAFKGVGGTPVGPPTRGIKFL